MTVSNKTGSSIIGLIARGGKGWIAGVNYISSLLFANTLQSEGQQQLIHLFLHQQDCDEKDYKSVSKYATSVDLYDFYYGARFPILSRYRQSLREAWRNREFPHQIKNNLPDLLIKKGCQIVFPANNLLANGPASVKTISWIPDFQYKYFPQYFPNPVRIDHGIRRVLTLSDLVIVSNESSKKDVEKFFPEFIPKIRVMPFTMWLGPNWKSLDYKITQQKYNLPEKYLIYPSQLWIHKNHLLLFKAITRLKQMGQTDIQLVCTGQTNDYRNPAFIKDLYSFIDNQGLQDNVRILGLLPRQDQIQLLRGAAALVQPSLYEGYSALIDEAQSLGKNIILSDIPMHREQQEEDFEFFDPNDPLDLAEKLHKSWPNLDPGPNLKTEREALENYQKRLITFGDLFREICQSII